MRYGTIAALVMLPAVLSQTPATALPCITIEQCRATVSGIGGFCVPNQFYNPCGKASRRSSRYR